VQQLITVPLHPPNNSAWLQVKESRSKSRELLPIPSRLHSPIHKICPRLKGCSIGSMNTLLNDTCFFLTQLKMPELRDAVKMLENNGKLHIMK
jgi:hypothetical protein